MMESPIYCTRLQIRNTANGRSRIDLFSTGTYLIHFILFASVITMLLHGHTVATTATPTSTPSASEFLSSIVLFDSTCSP